MSVEKERENRAEKARKPCGRIRFSLKDNPRISEISRGMQAMLEIPGDDEKWLEILKSNPTIIFAEAGERQLEACVRAVRERGEPTCGLRGNANDSWSLRSPPVDDRRRSHRVSGLAWLEAALQLGRLPGKC